MLQLKNATPFAATLFSAPDPDGVDTLFAIVKGTFRLEPSVRPDDDQEPLVISDRYAGDPAVTGIVEPSDVSLAKGATDVLLLGSAWAPRGRTSTEVHVSFRVGPVAREAVVSGDRRWENGPLGLKPTTPEPFEKMPVVWERAFGGVDRASGDATRLDAEARNPAGTGFRLRVGGSPIAGTLLPNVEHPSDRVRSPGDRPAPCGFGPLAPHWLPRRSWAGTYDGAWARTRAPYLPADFDVRFLQCAPESQVVPGYLKGGEPCRLEGLSPAGPLSFSLPSFRISVTFRLDPEKETRPAALDTVILKPDAGRLLLVWRAAFPCDKKLLKVREVDITSRAA
jgi:hypothetical protein